MNILEGEGCENFGEVEYEDGVGRFMGYIGIMGPYLYGHAGVEAVSEYLIIHVKRRSPVSLLCDISVVLIDKCHAHLSGYTIGVEFISIEITANNYFLAFIDYILDVPVMVVAEFLEFITPE